jgi:DNA-binding NtrC family response regulator
MNILAVKRDRFQINELNEFFGEHKILTADSDNEAVNILKQNGIEMSLVSINSYSDFGLVKYINDNFPKTEVVLSIQKEMQDAFSVITNGKFKAVQNPLKLKELRSVL